MDFHEKNEELFKQKFQKKAMERFAFKEKTIRVNVENPFERHET